MTAIIAQKKRVINPLVINRRRFYIQVHQDVNHNTIQVELDRENLLDDVLYMILMLAALLQCDGESVVKLLDHQELACLFQYVGRYCP